MGLEATPDSLPAVVWQILHEVTGGRHPLDNLVWADKSRVEFLSTPVSSSMTGNQHNIAWVENRIGLAVLIVVGLAAALTFKHESSSGLPPADLC